MKRVIALHTKRSRGADEVKEGGAAHGSAAADAAAPTPAVSDGITTLPTDQLHDAVAAHAFGEPPNEPEAAEADMTAIELMLRQKRAKTVRASDVPLPAVDTSGSAAGAGAGSASTAGAVAVAPADDAAAAADDLYGLLDWRGRGFRR